MQALYDRPSAVATGVGVSGGGGGEGGGGWNGKLALQTLHLRYTPPWRCALSVKAFDS